jgi:hypothetical protein
MRVLLYPYKGTSNSIAGALIRVPAIVLPVPSCRYSQRKFGLVPCLSKLHQSISNGPAIAQAGTDFGGPRHFFAFQRSCYESRQRLRGWIRTAITCYSWQLGQPSPKAATSTFWSTHRWVLSPHQHLRTSIAYQFHRQKSLLTHFSNWWSPTH